MNRGAERDPREAKLPVWAQNKMRVLRMRLDEARAEVIERDRIVGESRVTVSPYSQYARPLPEDDAVRFQVASNHLGYIDCRILHYGGKRVLDVSGGDLIGFLPRAANHAYITILTGDDR